MMMVVVVFSLLVLVPQTAVGVVVSFISLVNRSAWWIISSTKGESIEHTTNDDGTS